MSEQPPVRPGQDGDRCPTCGARVVASQQWCTLCHDPLDRPAPAGPPDDPGPAASAGRDPVGPSTLPPGAAEAMLAELAAATAADRPLARGPFAGRSRAVRTGLALGAALVLAAVGVALLTLVGLLL